MKTNSLLKNILRGGLAAALAAFLPSCFEMKQDVTIKKDGSGTLEMTTILGAQAVAMMKMAAQGGEGVQVEQGGNPLDELKDAEKMKANAAKMGEGIEYVESRDIKFDDGREGVAAVFKFTDINKVKVNMNSSPGEEEEGRETAPALLSFALEKGDSNKLTIIMPQPAAGEKAAADDEPVVVEEGGEEFDAAAMAMMAPMMQGMRVGMAVTVDGEITKTNAAHRDGNKIVLMDIDMGKLFANPEMMKKLSNPDDLSDFNKFSAVAKQAGATIEPSEKIEVEFK